MTPEETKQAAAVMIAFSKKSRTRGVQRPEIPAERKAMSENTTDTPITDEFERATCDGLDSALKHARDLERLLNQTRALNAFQVHEWPHSTTHAHQVVTLETALELQRQLADARVQRDRLAEALRGIKDRCTDETIKLHPDADAKGCVDDCLEWSEQALASLERKEEG